MRLVKQKFCHSAQTIPFLDNHINFFFNVLSTVLVSIYFFGRLLISFSMRGEKMALMIADQGGHLHGGS